MYLISRSSRNPIKRMYGRYLHVQLMQNIRPISNPADTNITLQIHTTKSITRPAGGLPPGMQHLYKIMATDVVASMHDIHTAYFSRCSGRSHFEDTAYRLVPLSRRHQFDRKRGVWVGFIVTSRYRKWYSGLMIITHEVCSRNHGICIDFSP